MIRINLLPPEYRAQARQRQWVILGIFSGALVVAGMILFLLGRLALAASLQKQIRGLQGELSELQTVVNQIKQMDAARSEIQNKVNVIDKLGKKRLTYPILFDDFLALLPSGVWIINLQTSTKGSGLSLVFQAKAVSNVAIANWLSNLQASRYFHSPQIGPINYDAQSASFTLTCDYEHPAAAQG